MHTEPRTLLACAFSPVPLRVALCSRGPPHSASLLFRYYNYTLYYTYYTLTRVCVMSRKALHNASCPKKKSPKQKVISDRKRPGLLFYF
jgi:hypothetical protein